MRQVVDWIAAVWAGLLSATLFMLISVAIPWLLLGDPGLHLRLIASLALGPSVIPSDGEAGVLVPLLGVAILLILSVLFACVVAFVVHREGWILSAMGGALLGLVLYVINFWTMSLLFPWLFTLRNWMLLLGHVVFGAVVGAVYELLEVERYVPVEPVHE
jgi:hypothetical protein